jgi:hypothetical protein
VARPFRILQMLLRPDIEAPPLTIIVRRLSSINIGLAHKFGVQNAFCTP